MRKATWTWLAIIVAACTSTPTKETLNQQGAQARVVPPAPPAPSEVHFGDWQIVAREHGPWLDLSFTVLVHDEIHGPVGGVVPWARIDYGATPIAVACITGSDGRCQTPAMKFRLPRPTTVEMCVMGIDGTTPYKPESNHGTFGTATCQTFLYQ